MVWIKPILMIEKKGLEQAEEEEDEARTHWNCLDHI
jgi:hypothetical protein